MFKPSKLKLSHTKFMLTNSIECIPREHVSTENTANDVAEMRDVVDIREGTCH